MSEKRQFRAIRGVRDILPPETALWNRVEQTAREVFATYGYGEIRLPIFEETELFARSVGADTDIVSKEMYTFERTIEVFRRGALNATLPKTQNEAREFKANLMLLVTRLRQELDDWKIEPTEENRSALDELTALTNETFDLPEGLEYSEAWRDILGRIAKVAGRIRVGGSESLRPEATASVCRAYIEHGMHTLPGDVKLYYIGPMFRRERPQKGRYRQFYQIGAEVLGQSDAPAIDAEVIEMLMVFFEKAGLRSAAVPAVSSEKNRQDFDATGCTLYINSIGCRECRPKYVEKLRAALVEHINELGADSQRRVETNPLRVLDSKLEHEQAVIEKLPRIGDHLCEACRAHFAEVKKQLELRGVTYQENWRLVRGLDYYMRTTFEITAPGLGAQNAVCGGGRYDGLVELLGGPPTKGIGFAIGTDRLVLSLQETRKDEAAAAASTGAFIAWMGGPAFPAAVKLARRLRGAGVAVELPAEEMKLKKALGLASKMGARYAIIIGENEITAGKYALKSLADGQQETLAEEDIVARLKGNSAAQEPRR